MRLWRIPVQNIWQARRGCCLIPLPNTTVDKKNLHSFQGVTWTYILQFWIYWVRTKRAKFKFIVAFWFMVWSIKWQGCDLYHRRFSWRSWRFSTTGKPSRLFQSWRLILCLCLLISRWREATGCHQSISIVFAAAGIKSERWTAKTSGLHGDSSSLRCLPSAETGQQHPLNHTASSIFLHSYRIIKGK